MESLLLQAATSDPLAEYGAIGVLAASALAGLIWTVRQYKASNERFIRYLEQHANRQAELMTTVANTLARVERALERMADRGRNL
jgi:hypothetical protein